MTLPDIPPLIVAIIPGLQGMGSGRVICRAWSGAAPSLYFRLFLLPLLSASAHLARMMYGAMSGDLSDSSSFSTREWSDPLPGASFNDYRVMRSFWGRWNCPRSMYEVFISMSSSVASLALLLYEISELLLYTKMLSLIGYEVVTFDDEVSLLER